MILRPWILVILLLIPASLKANPLEAKDKQQHFAASFVLALVLGEIYGKYYGTGLTMGIGLLKEMTDKEVDPGDIGANMLGAMITIPIDL
jgi:hypothetical protein